jgi:redox-sensitive bicupin YhaK (pirin superfamily)
MGNVGVVAPGAVQYLSAGTGIRHSEYNHLPDKPVHLVQMWVLPRQAGLKPQYGQVDYTLAERTDRWLAIASGRESVASRITIFQDAAAFVAHIEHTELAYRFDPGRFGFLFVASGQVTANDVALEKGDAVRLAGPIDLRVSGSGELVLWDVPGLAT